MLEDFSPKELKNQFKTNKTLKMVTIGVGSIIVLILGYFSYKQFIWKPANEKSKEAYYAGLNYAVKDSVDAAIGELQIVVKKYDGKQGGELAQYTLARQYMAKGEFQKALKELEGVSVNDTYISIYRLGLMGDCYSELGKYQDAMELYIEAAEKTDNEKTSPEYFFKAGLCAEELKDFEKATELYTRIKENYLAFSNIKTIDKYIARVKNKKIKK